MCKCAYLCVDACVLCTVSLETRRAFRSPGAEVIDGCTVPHVGAGFVNSDPVKDQVLLTLSHFSSPYTKNFNTILSKDIFIQYMLLDGDRKTLNSLFSTVKPLCF